MEEDGTGHGKHWGTICTRNLHLFAFSVFDCVASRHCSTPTSDRRGEGFRCFHSANETSQVWVEGPDGTQLAEARGSVST